MKFSTIIATTFTVLVLIISLVGMVLFSNSLNRDFETQLGIDLQTITAAKQKHVQWYMENNAEDIQLITSRTKMRSLLIEYQENKSSAVLESLKNILMDAKEPFYDVRRISLYDTEGNLIVSTDDSEDEPSIPIDYKNIDKISTEIKIDDAGKLYMEFFGTVEKDDQFIGMLIVEKTTEKLNMILSDSRGLGSLTDSYLVDPQGYPVTQNTVDPDGMLKRKIITPHVQECIKELKQNPVTANENPDVKQFIDSSARHMMKFHSYIDNPRLCLISEIETDKVLQDYKTSIFYYSLLVVALMTIIIFLGSIYVSNKVSKPLRNLGTDIDEITKGNLEIKLQKTSVDEINIVINSLNRILASLKLAVEKVGIRREELALGEVLKEKEKAEQRAKLRQKQLERFAKLAVGRELQMRKLKEKLENLENKEKKAKSPKKRQKTTVKKKKSSKKKKKK